MKRNILFVTDRCDDTDGGLSYAFDLARMMDKGIAVLLLRKDRLMGRFETADVGRDLRRGRGARDGPRDPRDGKRRRRRPPRSGRPRTIEEACAGSGLPTQISNGSGDMVDARSAATSRATATSRWSC